MSAMRREPREANRQMEGYIKSSKSMGRETVDRSNFHFRKMVAF